jgi:hypothetical protein
MELNPGLQNEKSAPPVSQHSPTFLLLVGYCVTTSVVSEALLNRVTSAARQVWVLPSLYAFMWNIKPSQLRSVHKKTWWYVAFKSPRFIKLATLNGNAKRSNTSCSARRIEILVIFSHVHTLKSTHILKSERVYVSCFQSD